MIDPGECISRKCPGEMSGWGKCRGKMSVGMYVHVCNHAQLHMCAIECLHGVYYDISMALQHGNGRTGEHKKQASSYRLEINTYTRIHTVSGHSHADIPIPPHLNNSLLISTTPSPSQPHPPYQLLCPLLALWKSDLSFSRHPLEPPFDSS